MNNSKAYMISELPETVYIIDDSEIDTFILKRFIKQNIEKSGNKTQIIEFEFAQLALDFLNEGLENNNGFKFPKLIFLDINMPDMDGFEFLTEFLKYNHVDSGSSKIILISSSDSEADMQRSKSFTQIIKYVKKPISDELVINSLQIADLL